MKLHGYLIALLGIFLVGCSTSTREITGDRVTIVVPGVWDNAGMYSAVIREIEKTGTPTQYIHWGSAMVSLNFSDPATHAQAERELANQLVMIPEHVKRIDIIAHSAGCGVTLGALGYTNRSVNHVVLLAPSVSPQYDLTKALKKASTIDSFYSDQDIAFLKLRTGNFGTYDGIKTEAAGHRGFDLSGLPKELNSKLREHPYDPSWKTLGNDGGHLGTLSGDFIRAVVLPIIKE